MTAPASGPERGGAVEALARRDRWVVLAGLFALCALAWGQAVALAGRHGGAALLEVHARSWGAGELGACFAMWAVMMVAMMAPTAAPMLLALGRIGRARATAPGPLLPATAFLLGYLLVWAGYSALAALAQWRLHELALVSAAGESRSAAFAGALLLAAGAFQLTPAKRACLRRCRSPLFFLIGAWRPGSWGALRMGVWHGAFCAGCCWALMALMFVGGAMNLVWCAGLMLFMLAEKALPAGEKLGQAAGWALLVWGALALGGAWLRNP